MATVIDALVITLGLDSRGMIAGQQQAIAGVNNLINQLTSKGQQIQSSGNAITATLGRIGLGFGKLAAVGLGAVAAFAEYERAISRTDAATAQAARNIGMSATSLSGWQTAARAAGGSAEGITAAFSNLSQQIAHFQFTGEPFAGMNWLNSLGVGLIDATGHLKTMDKLFIEVSDEMSKRGYSAAQKQQLLSNVFGGQAEDLRKIEDRARRAGMSVDEYQRHMNELGHVTDEAINRHQRLNDRWLEMEARLGGIGRTLDDLFGPTFMNTVEKVTDAIDKFFLTVSRQGWEAAWKTVFPSWVVDSANAIGRAFDAINSAAAETGKFLNKGVQQWGDFFNQHLGIGAAQGNTPPPNAAPTPETQSWIDKFNAATAGGAQQGGGGFRSANTAAAKAAMMQQLRAEGVPETNLDAAASLLVGQAIAESGLNPNTVHDQGTGFGIYGARLGRRDRMLQWLRDNGFASNDLEGQAKYMAHEAMSGAYPRTRAALIGANQQNLQQGTQTLTDEFEAPRVRNYDRRYRDTLTGTQTNIPNVLTGAGGAAASSPSNITNSNTSTTNSNSNSVEIHSMNITTPNPEDFAKRLQPALTEHGFAAQENYGIA